MTSKTKTYNVTKISQKFVLIKIVENKIKTFPQTFLPNTSKDVFNLLGHRLISFPDEPGHLSRAQACHKPPQYTQLLVHLVGSAALVARHNHYILGVFSYYLLGVKKFYFFM